MIKLSTLFTRMTPAETFALADACAVSRAAIDNGEGALCSQFIADAYTAAASGVSVEDALQDWYKGYALHCGASVSDKGRVNITGLDESGQEAFKRARNSFNVAKSAIMGAYKAHREGLVTITDGGSLFLNQSGMPRSKGELLAFARDAKKATEGTDLQKAMARLVAAFKAASKLSDTDNDIFMDTCRSYLANPESVGGEDEDAE